MFDWTEVNGQLVLTSSANSLVYFILLFMGGIFLIGSIIGFIISKSLFGYFLSSSICSIGLIFLFVLIDWDKKETIIFNPLNETIKFKITEKDGLEFSYGAFQKFFLTEIITQRNKGTRVQYLLFIIKMMEQSTG